MTKYTSLETSRKLHEAFPEWDDLDDWYGEYVSYGDLQSVAPKYNIDYLLDRLPKKIQKAEIIHYLTLSAKYGDEFKANYVSPSGYLYFFCEPEDDELVEALALLALKLKKEGIL